MENCPMPVLPKDLKNVSIGTAFNCCYKIPSRIFKSLKIKDLNHNRLLLPLTTKYAPKGRWNRCPLIGGGRESLQIFGWTLGNRKNFCGSSLRYLWQAVLHTK